MHDFQEPLLKGALSYMQSKGKMEDGYSNHLILNTTKILDQQPFVFHFL